MRPLSVSILFTFLIATGGKSQDVSRSSHTPFRVVGYYLLNTLLRDSLQKEQAYSFLSRVSHVNLAFINPDTAGNFRLDLPISSFIKKAHEKNVKVLASIAGGGPHTYYARLLQADQRKMLVDNIVNLIAAYNFDGVDVDLEGNDIDSNYEAFVAELSASLRPPGKLLTAAIATVYKDKLSDKALEKYDFLNLMSYDRTGPWNPRKPGHHSPYNMAEEDLEYWGGSRLIAKEKLVLGLPFYGYGFGSNDSTVASMSFKDIVAAYPNSTAGDTILLNDQRTMFYNGSSTIKKKTELAIKKASGVMIWQLSGDAPSQYSLLDVINRTVKEAALKTY